MRICPFCSNTKSKEIYSKGNFKILRCLNCKLGYLYPRPTEEQIEKLYCRDYFEKEETGEGGYRNYSFMAKVLEKESMRKLNFIKEYSQSKELLDVGCGLGTFLRQARKYGYDASGNDISDWAGRKLKASGIKFYKGSVAENVLPKGRFGIITAWDVFEHTYDINSTLKSVRAALREKGLLFLTTPNIDGWDAKLFGRYWYGYKKIPEHVLYFSKESLSRILLKNGFEIVQICTWGFERELGFVSEKVGLYFPLVGKIMNFLVSPIANVSLYFPMIDMMIVARKKK